MSRVLNCVKVSHGDNFIWMISTKDRLYGEEQALKPLKKVEAGYDLQLNWLIIDIVDENRDSLIESVSVRMLTEEKKVFNELDTFEQQIALESEVQRLIGRGAFGHKIFRAFRDRLLELIERNDEMDRVGSTVEVGLQYRYVKEPSVITSPNKGYIPVELVKNGECKIGLTLEEIQELQQNFELGENLVRNIYSFLLAEYAGKDYLEQLALIAEATKQIDTSADTQSTKAKKSTKPVNDIENEYPTLLNGDNNEDAIPEKKVAETLSKK